MDNFCNIVFIPILALPEIMTNDESLIPKFNLYGSKLEEPIYHPERQLIVGQPITEISIKPCFDIIKEQEEMGNKLYPLLCNAIIDTGAHRSAIRKSKLESCEWYKNDSIFSKGYYWPVGEGEKKPASNINISIHIDNIFPGNAFMDICAIVTEWHDIPGNLGYDFIIGRDIMQYCVLNYNGPKGYFTFDFYAPSI